MRIRRNRRDLAFDIVAVIILALLLLAVAYPLYFVVIASVSDPRMVSTGKVLFYPQGFNLDGYIKVIEYEPIWIGYRNTIIYTLSHTFVSVSISLLSGYALSRSNLVGKGAITSFFIITMFFSGGLIPTYLMMSSLSLTGKPITIILMGAVNVHNIIISRTFIKSSIPEELYEAASIDGCSHTRFFVSIVVPLSKALIAVLVLFAAVGQWNAWFGAMIYLNNDDQMPLQMVLRELLIKQSALGQAADTSMFDSDMSAQLMLVESMKYAVIIVSTLPIMCIYPFVQKYFVKGIMIGSVKG